MYKIQGTCKVYKDISLALVGRNELGLYESDVLIYDEELDSWVGDVVTKYPFALCKSRPLRPKANRLELIKQFKTEHEALRALAEYEEGSPFTKNMEYFFVKVTPYFSEEEIMESYNQSHGEG